MAVDTHPHLEHPMLAGICVNFRLQRYPVAAAWAKFMQPELNECLLTHVLAFIKKTPTIAMRAKIRRE